MSDSDVTGDVMTQEAVYPAVLEGLVRHVRYRPGWSFQLKHIDRGQGCKGLTLDVITCGYDSYHLNDGQDYRVHHYMPVPAAAYDERSWCRWIFEQILLIERHEAMEFFTLVHGGEVERPYAPNHGPGNDPYIVADLATDEERRTSFRGAVKG